MPVVRRATENNNTTWLPLPEKPLARFVLVKPALRLSPTFGNWKVNFGLSLHPEWRERVLGKPKALPENTQQSDRAFHSVNLSLGYIKDGMYQTTNLIDFMTACFGVEGGKKFRAWVEAGGGPPRPLDRDDDVAEIKLIGDWLGWMEGLEVFGSIRHDLDRSGNGVIWARFGGEMPIGSLPDQEEPDYQTLAEGKLRSMVMETKAADEAYEKLLAERRGRPLTAPKVAHQPAAVQAPRSSAPEQEGAEFDAMGRPIAGEGGNGVSPDDEEDPPF